MFWKEPSRVPIPTTLRTIWSGGDFLIIDNATDTVVLRISAGNLTVAGRLPAGSITSADVETNGLNSGNLALDTVQVATVSLTNAEIKALNTAPKELVAAPGAGKLIEFLGATLFHDYGANALTGDHALTIGLDDGTVAVAATIAHGDFAHQVADYVYSVKAAVAFHDAAADVLNKNLALTAAGDYAGNAGNDTVWTVHVAYRIIDFS